MLVERNAFRFQSSSSGLAMARTECQKGEWASSDLGSAKRYKNEPRYILMRVKANKVRTFAPGFHIRNSPNQNVTRSCMEKGTGFGARVDATGTTASLVEGFGRAETLRAIEIAGLGLCLNTAEADIGLSKSGRAERSVRGDNEADFRGLFTPDAIITGDWEGLVG